MLPVNLMTSAHFGKRLLARESNLILSNSKRCSLWVEYILLKLAANCRQQSRADVRFWPEGDIQECQTLVDAGRSWSVFSWIHTPRQREFCSAIF
ncbi:hypothetical protein EMIT093MI4_50002 [Pseudomonas sp. IT-93MI4]